MNYNPELAYAHPVVVLEEVGALVRTISEGRLLDKKGGLHDISNPRSLFVEIKTKCFEICFPKEYITQLKLEKQVEDLTDDKKRLEKQIEDLQKELIELRAK
ncbi:hypothetical protein [Brevibacillus agri]|uniref:hypothetical protein n=1 Tax=Brevibacillus agri TaxID=51101 RepID=UPI002E1D9364|nr:hypothetical protein [Brevibacillus agri]